MTPDEVKKAGRINARMTRDRKLHDERCSFYEDCYRVYRGELKPRERDVWQSDLHPAWAWQVVETIVANSVDDQPTSRVVGLTPEAQAQAENVEHLLNWHRNQDGFDRKLASFYRQAYVVGLTVAKIPWEYREAVERERMWEAPEEVGGDPVEKSATRKVPVVNWPGFRVVDVRDFWWNKAATSMQDAQRVYYKTRETRAALKRLEKTKANPYGIYKNIDDLPPRPDGDSPEEDEFDVVEEWVRTSNGVHLHVLADGKVLIRDEPSPFWHDDLPFVAASVAPMPFKFAGRAITELVADLQSALWDTLNHRMDSTAWVSNPLVRLDGQAMDKLDQVYPGAKVEANAGEVEFIAPPQSVIEAALAAEQTLMQTMQDLSAASPYVSGAADQATVDTKTATEVSLVQGAASRRMQSMRREIGYALQDAGRQQIKLEQQLLSAPEAVRVTGDAGVDKWITVDPSEIQERFDFEVEDVNESINRQERRSEAILKVQVIAGIAPLLAEQGIGANWKALLQDFSEAFGDAPDKYIVELPPPPPMAMGMGAPGLLAPGSGAGAPPSPLPVMGGAGGAQPALSMLPGGGAA